MSVVLGGELQELRFVGLELRKEDGGFGPVHDREDGGDSGC